MSYNFTSSIIKDRDKIELEEMFMSMNIVKVDETNAEKVVPLIAAFRVTLQSYKNIHSEPDDKSAKEEVFEFLEKDYPIYAIEQNDEFIGYIVCRIEEPCLWVEHIYVMDEYRRCGAASMLFGKAEEIAESMGEDTVYNFVHPNNEDMISFLRSKGYTVLNMLEIRKSYKGEELSTTIHVDENTFDY